MIETTIDYPKLHDSLGEIPVTAAGKIDRFELQHPALTYVALIGGGVSVGALVAEVEAPSSGKPYQQHYQNNVHEAGELVGGGLLLGVTAYSCLRAALRTRFGWGNGTRRGLGEGPVPPVRRFTSLSTESIRERKKRAEQG